MILLEGDGNLISFAGRDGKIGVQFLFVNVVFLVIVNLGTRDMAAGSRLLKKICRRCGSSGSKTEPIVVMDE